MERVLPSVLTFVLLAAPARAQWSVTGMLGDASTSPAQIAIESRPPGVEMDIGPVSFADESSRSPWYYGWRVAYGMKGVPWLAIEAEFIHAKAITDPNEIVNSLVEQVTGQVRWRETIEWFGANGVTTLYEVGTGKVLSGLARRINRDLTPVSITTPQDVETALANLA